MKFLWLIFVSFFSLAHSQDVPKPGLLRAVDPSIPNVITVPAIKNQRYSIVPPIVTRITKPLKREEKLTCYMGSDQVGSRCVSRHTKECSHGYNYEDERCVSKYTTCPLNFEVSGFGACTERKLCPHNHVWKFDHCECLTQCPTGWKWNGKRCEIIRIECAPGLELRGTQCVKEEISCPVGFELINGQCEQLKICPPGYEMKASGFCATVLTYCPPGSMPINGECQATHKKCPPGTREVGDICYEKVEEESFCPPETTLLGVVCELESEKSSNSSSKVPGLICPKETYKSENSCYYHPNVTRRSYFKCSSGYHASMFVCEYPQPPVPIIRVTPAPPLPPGVTPAPPPPPRVIIDPPPPPRVIIDPPPPPRVIIDPPPPPRVIIRPPPPPPITRPPTIRCPDGTYWDGQYCVLPSTASPPCTQKCSQNTCQQTCSSGQCNGSCDQGNYQYTAQTQCPYSFTQHRNRCYRCPQNYHLCGDECVSDMYSC